MSPVMNAIDGGSAGSRAGTAVASDAAGGAAAPGGRSAGTAVVLGRAAVPPQAATRTARAMLQGLRVMKRSVESEEHTSELQSLRHLVCRLLLEKINNLHFPRVIAPE